MHSLHVIDIGPSLLMAAFIQVLRRFVRSNVDWTHKFIGPILWKSSWFF